MVTSQQFIEKALKYFVRTVFVGFRKGCAFASRNSQMVGVRRVHFQALLNVTEALFTGKLGINHGNKLMPGIEALDVTVAVMFTAQSFKLMSR